MAPPIRLLTFSSLFPNAAQPNHGVFVENRLRHLVASGEATATVLAPVPWFPSRARVFGRWAAQARAPLAETRHGLRVLHPRFAAIPRLGMNVAPSLLFRAAASSLERLGAGGFAFDLIDAHYLYPDGVAAIRLGRRFRKPVVLTARGSDVTQFPDFPGPRRRIQEALAEAAAIITVSAALGEDVVKLGASPSKVTVLRNGVDAACFHPVAREPARRALEVSGPTIVSVGHLIERKRHHLTIEAMRLLPECTLLIAGDGPERARLSALVERLGLGDRVRLLGARPHDELAGLYGASDVSVLASSREGWANVLLEAMACGTPVVAMPIGGNAEVVRAPEAGLIAAAETPDAIASGVRQLLAAPPDRAATRAYAERFGWRETTEGQLAIFRRVLGQTAGASTGASTGGAPAAGASATGDRALAA